MPAPRPGGARFVQRQFLHLMSDDLRTIGTALRRAIPQLRFVLLPELVDREATRAAGLYDQRKGRKRPVIATPPSSWIIRYADDLNCPDDRFQFPAWLEPANWNPDWRQNKDGQPYLANDPETLFYFTPCRIYAWGWNGMAAAAPPGCEADQYLFLAEGSFSGVYYPWEPEKERMLRRVRRIFDKHTTNKCCSIEPETLKPKHISTKGALERIGLRAAAWAMEHPRHFLGRDLTKPIEWAEKYPNGWHAD